MQRKLVGGLMIFALLFCVRTAWVAAAGDDGDIPAEVRAALKQLDSGSDRTAASRLNLAKIAISTATAKATKDPKGAADAWEAAREALLDADRVEPHNKEVATLLATVQKHIPAATQPATKPMPEPPATKPGPATQAASPDFVVKREATAAEINRIRQIEWRHDENPPPSLRIDPELRKKFLAASSDITPREFNQLTPIAQAAAILDSKKEEFFPAVIIRTDPASLREFRAVDLMLEQNCASCHKDNKAGRFTLFSQKNEAAMFSNFIILQSYSTKINDAQRLMVDRTAPESSLLLSFMLPAAQTDTPHPAAQGWKPAAKTKNDPHYQMALKWLKTLDTLAPSYGIDLSEDAPAVPPRRKSDVKMPPVAMFVIAVLITLGGAAAGRIVRRQHRKRLLKLAAEWRMNYSPGDQFRITPRVFANFPVPGAAKIRVVDLVYGIDQDLYRYIFTAEYTAGVVSGKRRIRRAGSLSEPRDRAISTQKSQITLAPANLPLLDQYRRVHQEIHSEGQPTQGRQI